MSSASPFMSNTHAISGLRIPSQPGQAQGQSQTPSHAQAQQG